MDITNYGTQKDEMVGGVQKAGNCSDTRQNEKGCRQSNFHNHVETGVDITDCHGLENYQVEGLEGDLEGRTSAGRKVNSKQSLTFAMETEIVSSKMSYTENKGQCD